jgi:hypothetical protein
VLWALGFDELNLQADARVLQLLSIIYVHYK